MALVSEKICLNPCRQRAKPPSSGKGKAKGPAKKPTTAPSQAGPAGNPKPSRAKKGTADECILTPVSIGGPYIGGKKLGANSDVTVTLAVSRRNDQNPWLGVVLGFPLGKDNENDGFGVRYEPVFEAPEKAKTCVTWSHDVKIKFPRGQYKAIITNIAGSDQLDPVLRDQTKLCRATITLDPQARVQVEGFGLPFANPSHPSHGWVNDDAPIVGDVALSNILQQREFVLLVNLWLGVLIQRFNQTLMPPPFSYPYGKLYQHGWDPQAYRKCIEAAPRKKGDSPFMPRFSFEDDNEMVTAMAQGAFQEAFFLDHAVQEIAKFKLPAYFVPKSEDSAYVIIARPKDFVEQYEKQWPRLTSDGLLKVLLREDWVETVDPPMDGKVKKPRRILNWQPGSSNTLPEFPPLQIMQLMITLTISFWRSDMTNARRRVTAVLDLRPGENPTCTVNIKHLRRRMALQRDVMRGTGFYETLKRNDQDLALDLAIDHSELKIEDNKTSDVRLELGEESVPFQSVINLLAKMDPELADAIVDLALPEDRSRFRAYLERRHLGIGIIATPGGTGKTTALCAATLAMIFNKDIGSVFGSGPTNVAISTCAERLYWTGVAVTDRFNAGKEEDAQVHRPLVVRGYKLSDELKAFHVILGRGQAPDDDSIPRSPWSPQPAWKYALSPCNWLLVALGHKLAESSPVEKAVKTLHDRDQPVLHEIRRELEANQLAAAQNFLRLSYMVKIISSASAVLTTPSCAYIPPPRPRQKSEPNPVYQKYRLGAGAVLVDEAGCMLRSDLLSVWGNTLRPLFMAGDTKQLTPPDMEPQNRFSLDLTNSALNFFQGSGLPVYRLRGDDQ
ncbi:hypothetical protein V8F33_011445 [Rhypophila sp. PSN 637]